ncbi:MAG: 2-oxo acid dehydrogenase subunit E2 [Bdellovibrio sp.]|nr:2-oxo acid dehydrogenase subunit E2 [Bdellovibrio sp.]
MYTIRKLSRYRRCANSILQLSNAKNVHPIYLNTEIQIPPDKKNNFVPFFMKKVAEVLQDNPEFKILNSVLERTAWRSRVIIFDDLSFSVAVHKEFEGGPVVIIYVLHDVMKKSLIQIENEYKKLSTMPIEEFPLFIKLKKLFYIPAWLHRPIFALWAILFPRDYLSYGSMGFSNLGQGSILSFFPSTSKTLIMGIGGIRDIGGNSSFTLNVVFNHYVVDGKICAQFIEKIKAKIEMRKMPYTQEE